MDPIQRMDFFCVPVIYEWGPGILPRMLTCLSSLPRNSLFRPLTCIRCRGWRLFGGPCAPIALHLFVIHLVDLSVALLLWFFSVPRLSLSSWWYGSGWDAVGPCAYGAQILTRKC